MYDLNITLAKANDLLNSIVAEFGEDHRAVNAKGGTGCVYAEMRNGVLVPVCIVGQVFARLGLLGLLVFEDPTGYVATDSPNQESACVTDAGLWDSLARVGITVETEARQLFREVQAEQDADETWGVALRNGRKAIEEARLSGLPWR